MEKILSVTSRKGRELFDFNRKFKQQTCNETKPWVYKWKILKLLFRKSLIQGCPLKMSQENMYFFVKYHLLLISIDREMFVINEKTVSAKRFPQPSLRDHPLFFVDSWQNGVFKCFSWLKSIVIKFLFHVALKKHIQHPMSLDLGSQS